MTGASPPEILRGFPVGNPADDCDKRCDSPFVDGIKFLQRPPRLVVWLLRAHEEHDEADSDTLVSLVRNVGLPIAR